MSFRCIVCGNTQPNGTPAEMVVLKERSLEKIIEVVDPRTHLVTVSSGSVGWQIIKEGLACPKCFVNPPRPEIEVVIV
ncbi:MAG: hypothetical protein PHF44_04615 [Candidatus Pacebacteria bacterium]|nr:hypothetical protein [Candidatus Paceibacterota bacterium]